MTDQDQIVEVAMSLEAKDNNLPFCDTCSRYMILADETIFGRRVFICPNCGKTLIERTENKYEY